MQTKYAKPNLITIAALLLVMPTAFFITISILKYQLNINAPYDAVNPLLLSLGIAKPLGWNINLLILFGPAIALLLTFFQVIKIKWDMGHDDFLLAISIQKRWWPLVIIVLNTGILSFLFLYFLGENCIC